MGRIIGWYTWAADATDGTTLCDACLTGILAGESCEAIRRGDPDSQEKCHACGEVLLDLAIRKDVESGEAQAEYARHGRDD